MNIGFTDSEAKVYLALLRYNELKISGLVKETNLMTSTIYLALIRLLNKGLITYTLKNNVKYYRGNDIKILFKLIEDKKNDLKKVLNEIKKEKKEEDYVEIYKGNVGLRQLTEDVLKRLNKGDEYLFISVSKKELGKGNMIAFRSFILKKDKKGIKTKGLITKELKQKMDKLKTGIKSFKIKVVDLNLPNGVVIYKNTVALMNLDDEQEVILIRSKKIYKKYKSFFESLWNKNK